ncbi:MAG: THUMP domain-containing protein [Bacteroidota bacterium]
MEILAKTLYGLEGVLEAEIKALGGKDVKRLKRAVSFQGDKADLYAANLKLRTALRVLKPFLQFRAGHEDQLYRKIYAYDWSRQLKVKQTFAIDSITYSDKFRHSKYVAYKVKDAIVDQFRKKTGKRPSVDTQNPDLRINVHVYQQQFTISLDSSGEPLHKRGYRKKGHQAPLNEVLAAGMILLSGWQADRPFVDPMCGSGTLLMEAAMIARNMPPGLRRNQFGFMQWADYDEGLWKKLYQEARRAMVKAKVPIWGADVYEKAIHWSKLSRDNFGLEDTISLETRDFADLKAPFPEGLLMVNPPYGERLTKKDIEAFYQMIGDQLKQQFSGYDAWILSSNKEALKKIGLRPSTRLPLFNGSLECLFQHFELYQGSRERELAV